MKADSKLIYNSTDKGKNLILIETFSIFCSEIQARKNCKDENNVLGRNRRDQPKKKHYKDEIKKEIFKISIEFHQAKTIQISTITFSKTDSVMGVFISSDICLSMQHHAS